MPVCLSAGVLAATLATNTFTLAWTHSIEKLRWEEDWRVENAALRVVAARIHGSGAGMEPPPDARLRDGVWHYRPDLAPLESVSLRHSPYAGEYEICIDATCRPLSERLPGLAADAVVKIRSCPASTATDQ